MAHEDKGKYFKKHPEGTQVSETLRQAVLKQTKDNNISCKAAEKISRDGGAPMSDVGTAIDMLNINIAHCQLGLFGYDAKSKAVVPAESVSPQLEADIRAALVGNRLPCAAAWKIAEHSNLKRMDVCAACEALKIKVKPCQLGAF
ncbi:MAG: hypothetical protein K4445_07080 [Deltaproteobacteria bacterium]|jgi:hypothetical protein|nr:hypothetical protein [Syntrophaceae bacterium]